LQTVEAELPNNSVNMVSEIKDLDKKIYAVLDEIKSLTGRIDNVEKKLDKFEEKLK